MFLNKRFLLLTFLVCSINMYSSAFIISALKDVFFLLESLGEFNSKNRKLVSQQVKQALTPLNDNKKFTIDELYNAFEQNDQESSGEFTFKNLAGNIPVDVIEIVDFLKNPKRFSTVGAKMPHGILLVGPPGTGKTSIARAIAGEANAEFFNVTATQFIELYVGVGPQRVRELFQKARAAVAKGPKNKAIIFIDELDAIGGSRFDGDNSEYRNTLNELLNQMDGFNQDDSILVMGATNTPNSLDFALKRPGRFDRIVTIGLPDEDSRCKILEYYSKEINCLDDIDFLKFAVATRGLSPADLKNLVNEAAFRAAREDSKHVAQEHFDQAFKELQDKRRRNR